MALSRLKFSELHIGDSLPEVVKHLNQERINLYAEAVGDFNPIHIDESFAMQTAFGDTIAHGMLILAYVSEMMTLAFDKNWFSGGKLAIRFKTPARSKDIITVSGKVKSIEEDNGNLNFACEIKCQNQNQATIVTGEATVNIPSDR